MMIDASKPQRVAVLVFGARGDDLSTLQSMFPQETIQWTTLSEHDLHGAPEHLSRFDCLLVKVKEDAAELNSIAAIRDQNSLLPIIAFGSDWQVATVVHAMKQGAAEVCEFPENPGQFRGAFQRCLSAEARKQARFSDVIPKNMLSKLTSEEARILHLLVLGRTTKEVGATLDVSIRTVHYRKKELLRKLGVENRSEAIELIRLSAGNLLSMNDGLSAL